MNCAEIDGMLDRLMDDELTDEERSALEAHARSCQSCARAIRATMQMKALFAEMEPEADVPLEAQARWRGAVREASRQKKRRGLIRWVGSAAAAVVVLVGVGLALNTRNAPANDARTVRSELVEATEADAAQVEMAGETAMESAFEADTVESKIYASVEVPRSTAGGAPESVDMQNDAGSADDFAIMAPAAMPEEIADMASEITILEADGEDAPMCAALAQRAPARELRLKVEDLDAACDLIRDIVDEYEADADVQRLEQGGANVYVEVPAADAEDFLSAMAPLGETEAEPEEEYEDEAEEKTGDEAEEESAEGAGEEAVDAAEPTEPSDSGTVLMLVTLSTDD